MNTTIVNATEYRDLPLTLLTESKTNPRRIFEENALKELAETIRSQGVLSPLLVRPTSERSFEIVFGARRYRAAQLAEVATVPVRIKNLTDAEVLEAQLIENLQRRDVHPMEEANGFRALLNLEEPKYSIEQIAAKTGKSPVYVAARLRLTELSQTVVDAFYREEIGVGHALLLAKLQPAQQEQALAACFKEDWSAGGQKAKRILLPVRSLHFWIESNILLILKTRSVRQARCAACLQRREVASIAQRGQDTTSSCFLTWANRTLAPTPSAIRGRSMPISPRLLPPSPNSYKSARPMGSRRKAARHCPATGTSKFVPTSPPAKKSDPAGIQDMQVHHRSHCLRRHRQGRDSQGMHGANLPGASSQATFAKDRG
jgi:ParB/RepB/Spo0J family partition protein